MLAPAIRKVLEKDQNVNEVAERLVRMAKAGDMDAMKVLLDRVDGKVIAPVDITTDGEPLFKAYIGMDPDKV